MEPLKIIGVSFVGISVFLTAVFLLRKKESFFNLNHVVRKHLGLFANCKSQYIIFYVLPLFFSVGLSMLYEAGNVFYSQLIVVVSILLSMLLAILSILTGRDYAEIAEEKQREKMRAVAGETVNAIVFDSLLCILLLLYGLAMVVVDGLSFENLTVKRILAGAAYYIFTVILLNLLLIVKRMSRIIDLHLKAH